MSTDELHAQLESALEAFPSLHKAFPSNWPRGPKFKITGESLAEYNGTRTEVFRDRLNFPFLLHNLCQLESPERPALLCSMVEVLDWFAREHGHRPGANSLLRPLWNDAWSKQPRLWPVISEALMIRALPGNFPVTGFDRTITGTTKTADIEGTFNGRRVWIDVEAPALTRTVVDDGGGFRKFVTGRAARKMEQKFSDLSSDECGVVASVYRPLDNNFSLFKPDSKDVADVPSSIGVHVFAKIYWIHVVTDGDRKFIALQGKW